MTTEDQNQQIPDEVTCSSTFSSQEHVGGTDGTKEEIVPSQEELESITKRAEEITVAGTGTETSNEDALIESFDSTLKLHPTDREANKEIDTATENSNETVLFEAAAPSVNVDAGDPADKTPLASPPTGPGWNKLSERIYMCNLKPIKNGMNVFKGKRLSDGEWHDIAVKIMPFDEKHAQEIKVNQKLKSHPNVIHVFEAEQIHGGLLSHIYIAMELCSQTLKDFIDEHKGKPFDFNLHFDFAKQILSGIAYIHDNNILHRDIKLENILLSHSKDNIRVADFGISTQLKDGYSVATASARGIGSDGFCALELLSNHPKASFRSDSFSLGIVLGMLFSNGYHPFGQDPSRWRTNIMDNKDKDLSHIVKFAEPHAYKREQLIDLIELCLRPSPEGRLTPKQMLNHDFFTSTSARREPVTTPPSLPVVKQNTDTSPLDDFLISKKNKVKALENQLGVALGSGDIPKYTSLLAQLKQLQASDDDLEVILQLAEYELMSKKNDSPIIKLRDIISSSGTRSSLEVAQMAVNMHEIGQNLQGLMLFKVAHDLHKREPKFQPKHELLWIVGKVSGITTTLDSLFKQGGWVRDFARNFAVGYTEEMLADLRAVEGVSSGEKALQEMNCIVNVIGNTNEVRDHEKTIKYGEEGIAVMRREFGDGVVYYRSYGGVLNNLGNAYNQIGLHEKAQECYLAAIETHMKALDYESEELRQEHIMRTSANLDK